MSDTAGHSQDGLVSPIDTEYEIGQDNIRSRVGPFGFDIHNPVFLIAGLTIIAFVGSVFSPYYHWSGRAEPENHVAINVALYG